MVVGRVWLVVGGGGWKSPERWVSFGFVNAAGPVEAKNGAVRL